MATPRFASGSNVFIPQATGQAIAYVRDQSMFKVNQYVQIINSPKPVGVYAFLDPDAPVRVVSDAEFDWARGQPRPKPQANLGNFKWEEFRTFRRNYGYTIDEEIVDNADGWNPKAFFNAIMISLAMTNLTQRVTTLLEATANWSGNTATASNLNSGRGKWHTASNDESSANFLAIKKSLNTAVRRILLATNGMVQRKDLKLQISPDLADAISETSEIHTYLEKSPHALAQVKGEAPNVNADWSLPEKLYGLPLVIEDASKVNIRANADGTVATVETQKVFIRDKTKAVILSRQGGLDGQYGSPSFSTVQRYFHQYEMSIEAFRGEQERKDKIYESHVVDDYKEVLAAPQAGYLITECMSA